MVRYKRGLIVAGTILLVLGAVSIYSANSAHAYQSTFNILPGKYFKIAANLRDQTLITGRFQETSGRSVTFYIMSSAQFAAFQIGQPTGSLYALQDVPSGSLSFTSSVPDTYYLVFTHGTALLNTTETLDFQRTYLSLDEVQLAAGIVTIGLAILEIYWGVRPREAPAPPPPPRA